MGRRMAGRASVLVVPRPERRVQRCPYCLDSIDGFEPAWTCLRCRTTYHRECAAESERCRLLGCGAPVLSVREPAGDPRARKTTRVTVLALLFVVVASFAAGRLTVQPPMTEPTSDEERDARS